MSRQRRKSGYGVAVSALFSCALPALADEVRLFSECTFDGATYQIGVRQDQWKSSVWKRSEDAYWSNLTGMRHGWPTRSKTFVSMIEDEGRPILIAYRADDLGETEGRYAWVEASENEVTSGHGKGTCRVIEPHVDEGQYISGGGTRNVPELPLARCDFGNPAYNFYTDAEKTYVHYWRREGLDGGADYVGASVAAVEDDVRIFAYDDGRTSHLVGHSAARGADNAALAFVVLSDSTIGSGVGTGTCEVLN